MKELLVASNSIDSFRELVLRYYKTPEVLVISGQSYSSRLAEFIFDSEFQIIKVENNKLATENNIYQKWLTLNIKCIVAVGGGKVLDLSKRISLLFGAELFVFPTVISNDGLFSPVAVMEDDDGKSLSLKGRQPDSLYVDISIIENAPDLYLNSAIGDFLTNISACNDWILAHRNNVESFNSYAYFISRQSALDVLLFDKQLRKEDLIKKVVHCEILSGTAMMLSGNSRPCSGSEHLISHAIDYLKLGKGYLHGIQVASISLFTLYLQGDLRSKYIDMIEYLGIPLVWTEMLKDFNSNVAKLLYHQAKKMRPGRYTILDTIDENEFMNKLNSFIVQYSNIDK